MNMRIKETIDALFGDIEMTEEAQALRDELSADLNDRMNDLLSQGISEDEAIRQIRDDLAGFGELTERFPHRQKEVVKTDPAALNAERFNSIRIQLRQDDLTVLPSEDELIHMSLTGDPKAEWRSAIDNDSLFLEIVRPENEFPEGNTDTLSGLLLNVLNRISRNIPLTSCSATVRIPAGWKRTLNASTVSGDLRIDLPCGQLEAKSNSGDLEIHFGEGCLRAEAVSTSGDIRLDGRADTLSIRSVSGDITAQAAANTVQVSIVSGDIELSDLQAQKLDIKTTSGDQTVRGRSQEIAFKTVSGSLEFVLADKVKSIQGSSVSGSVTARLVPGQAARLEARSTSGSVRCSCPDGPDAAQLRMTSMSGNITVC